MKSPRLDYTLEVASTYDLDREGELHWIKEREFIAAYFSGKELNNVLDVPVGTGRFISYYPDSVNIIGIDASEHMLNQAQKEVERVNRGGVELKMGDAANLYFIRDHSIDVVVCCRLLHLVENSVRLNFLKEFSRVLVGDLVLQVYLDTPKINIFKRVFSKIFRIYRKMFLDSSSATDCVKPWSHIKSYGLSISELNGLLSGAGLKVFQSTRLCSYGRSDVMMYILRNEN